MSLFGSKKKEREAKEKAEKIELFHIILLMAGLSQEHSTKVVKEIYGVSLEELVEKGWKIRLMVRKGESGDVWTALGKGNVPGNWELADATKTNEALVRMRDILFKE
jgi:hypothetical protein